MTTPLLLAAALLVGTPPTDSGSLYRILLLRAAPGRLLEVIDLYKRRLPAAGEARPFILRHSQGDQWDLLLVFPMESDRLPRPDARFDAELAARVAWREEVFVAGPPRSQVSQALGGGEFYHIEMHLALPGRLADLRREREMENAYEAWLGRPQDLIFTRVAGAAWDVITIGTFRDIKHYAESADIPAARQDSAARAAGYESADAIGPYLRTLIDSHHDTLARAVR
jgi:hypothetical protein